MSPLVLFRASFLLASVGCVISCPFPDEDPIVCTEIAVAAVTVEVVGFDGAPTEGAVVTFRVDGGPEAACDPVGNGTFACGYEVAGRVEVIARSEAGMASAVLDVEHDGCHPIPEFVSLTLDDDVPCTEIAVPAVILDVVDAGGRPIVGVEGRYAVDDAAAFAPCEVWDDSLICAVERTGEITVLIEADGFDPQVRVYDVALDDAGCHPETVMDTVVLGTCED